MRDPSDRTFTADFRRFFLRGLVVVLPSVLTLWIVVKAYQFVDNTIAEPINRGVRLTIASTARVSPPLQNAFDPSREEVAAEIQEIVASGRMASRPGYARFVGAKAGPHYTTRSQRYIRSRHVEFAFRPDGSSTGPGSFCTSLA